MSRRNSSVSATPHLGDARDVRSPRRVTRGSRIASVTSRSPTCTTVVRSGSITDRVVEVVEQREHRRGVVEVDALLEREPGERAVGGAGVVVARSRARRPRPCSRWTCRCRPGRRRRPRRVRRRRHASSTSLMLPSPRCVQPRASSVADACAAASGSTEISAKPTCAPGECSSRRSSRLTPDLADLGEQARRAGRAGRRP